MSIDEKTEGAPTSPIASPPEAASPKAPPGDAPRRARWIRLARDVAIGLAIVLAIQWWQARGVAPEGLPDVSLTLLDGSTVALAGPRERARLIQLEASWCGVCRMEDATIRSLARDHDVLVVATQSGDAAAVRRFAEEHDLAGLQIAVDEQGALARALGVRAFPTTLFVDREGQIASTAVGYTTWLGMRARLEWAGR